ncbi:mucin-12-like [Patiria miniata]|uniref:Apple domain-containing protein n=1 Tax=Patiria miniata TaxID=46514 RepID=A0A914AC90_PATMI|nr:mucin-12-like [Patiria miniata]
MVHLRQSVAVLLSMFASAFLCHCASKGLHCQFATQESRRLTGSVFSEKSAVGSAVRCSALCAKHSRCVSFNYAKELSRCELNRNKTRDHSDKLKQDARFKYYEMMNADMDYLNTQDSDERTTETSTSIGKVPLKESTIQMSSGATDTFKLNEPTLEESTPMELIISTHNTTKPTSLELTTMEPTTKEPTAVKPTSIGQSITEPTTMEQTTTELTTTEPTTTEPTTTKPATAERTSMEPTTTEQTTTEPTAIEPTATEPITKETTTTEPTTKEPTTAERTSMKPTTTEQTTTKSTTIEPTTFKHTSTEPTTTGPTSMEPTTTEPTTAKSTTIEQTSTERISTEPATIETRTREQTTLGHTTEVIIPTDPIRESCLALKQAGYTTDGYYMIDPDGLDSGEEPFFVHCFTIKDGICTTLDHSTSGQSLNVTSYPFDVNISYFANGNQIQLLIDMSTICTQYLKATCKNAKLWDGSTQLAWWVSDQGGQMTNWGGVATGNDGCSCHWSSSITCEGGSSSLCNCGGVQDTWAIDDGTLKDKTRLPVVALHFEQVTPPGEISYQLDGIKCYTRG